MSGIQFWNAFRFPPLRIQMFSMRDRWLITEWTRISVWQFLRYWWRKKRGGWVFVELDAKGKAVVR